MKNRVEYGKGMIEPAPFPGPSLTTPDVPKHPGVRERAVNFIARSKRKFDNVLLRVVLGAMGPLEHKPVEEKHRLTVIEGGDQGSDIRSHRIITGPQGLKKTSGDVARSRIEGQEIPDNVLEHPRRYPGASQPPPIDAA